MAPIVSDTSLSVRVGDPYIPGSITRVQRIENDDGTRSLYLTIALKRAVLPPQVLFPGVETDLTQRLNDLDDHTQMRIRYGHPEVMEEVKEVLAPAFSSEPLGHGTSMGYVTLSPRFLSTKTGASNLMDRALFIFRQRARGLESPTLFTVLQRCAEQVVEQQSVWLDHFPPDAFEDYSLTTAEIMDEALSCVQKTFEPSHPHRIITPTFTFVHESGDDGETEVVISALVDGEEFDDHFTKVEMPEFESS